jgi:hypothetical protein
MSLWGASIFTGPLTVGLTGKAAVQPTFRKAMAEAAAKSLGSELMKNLTSGFLEHGISWGNLASAPYKGAEDFILTSLVSDALTERFQKSLINQGISNNALVQGYAQDVAGPMASYLANWVSLVKIASGVHTAAKKLEVIRQESSQIYNTLLDLEMRYLDALSEMEISRSVLEKCRKMWQV